MRYRNVYVYYATQCMEETGYVMTGSYNIAPIGVSPYAISPVAFRPAAPQVTMLDTRIDPDIPFPLRRITRPMERRFPSHLIPDWSEAPRR